MVIVLGFFSLLTVTFAVYSSATTENYKRLRLEGIEKAVELECEKMERFITGMERNAIEIASLGELALLSGRTSSDFGTYYSAESMNDFGSVQGMAGGGVFFEPYVLGENAERVFVYSSTDTETGYRHTVFSDDNYNYLEKDWYIEITGALDKRHSAAWSDPYYGELGSDALMTTVGAGIFGDGGRLLGVATSDWALQSLTDSLSTIKPTQNSYAQLSAGDSEIFLASAPEHTGADMEYMEFSHFLDNGWSISVYVPAKEIFAEVESRNAQFTMIIGLSAVFMLCAAFILISRLINSPLKKLTDEVSQIDLGNLDVFVNVNTKDELGLLANTFNKMTADLKSSLDELQAVTAEKERIGAELDVATKIQASMLPCIFPAFPGRDEFDVYASMQPAKEVGGDFYDFFLVDDNTLAVVMADVSGKGVPAALFMVIAKTLIKNNAQSGKSPKEVFEAVNNILCENNDADMFVTAILGYLDMPTGKFTFVNAGHNPPLLRSKSDDSPGGRFGWLKAKAGFVLAGMEDMFYKQHEVKLEPGDELFLYTDGVTEAVNNENKLFTDSKLLEAANRYMDLPLKEFTVSIKREIDEFAEGAEQADDITMLVLRYKGKGEAI